MKIIFTLFFSLGILHAGLSQNTTQVEITTGHVRDNIHVLISEGSGNVGVLSGVDGHVLIDDKFAPQAEKIKNALASIGPGAVTFTINTHYHFDHADGNKAFGPGGSWIVAHENTRRRLLQDNYITIGGTDTTRQEKYPADALPKLTFEHSMKLHLNGQTIYLFHVENAHTDTDAIIYFEEANVIHAGDVFVRYGIPFIDGSNGGTVGGMIRAANKIIELCDDGTIIIPGHGQLSGREDVIAYRDMLQDLWDQTASAVKAGKTLEEILANDPSKKYGEGNMGAYLIGLIAEELNK